jgi:hypothetical protein
MSLRPIPRVFANQFAKERAAVWLHTKYLTNLLNLILDQDSRDILQAATMVREVPSRVKDAKRSVIDAARALGALQNLTKKPFDEIKAAYGRAVKQLSRSRDPESKERLEAYQALQEGSTGLEDLVQLQDELERLAEKLKDFKTKRNRSQNQPETEPREHDGDAA